MGGGASKEKDYILRIDNTENSLSDTLQSQNAVSTSPRSGDNGSNPPNPMVRQQSKSGNGLNPPNPMARQQSKSGNGLNPPNAMARQQSKSGNGLNPPNPMVKQQSMNSNLSVGANGRLSKRDSKSNLLAKGRPSFRGGLRTSSRAGWLLKDANIQNATTDSFEYSRVIGQGVMGSVRIAKYKGNNSYVAIKSIRKDYVLKHNDHRHIQNEKYLLSSLDSPFCIRSFGTFQDNIHLHFIMEFAVGGELFRRLNKKASFPPAVAKFYASEIFCALSHVHQLGFCFRDLKPENIMLDEDGHCKLVDFGFSAKPDAQGLLHTNCGTPAYLSPEQLNGKFTNGYALNVDWWSFGILLYELLTGNTPFSKDNRETPYAIYLRILENKISFPYGFDPITKDLVSQLCHSDISKRLIEEEAIKKHNYFEMPWSAVNDRKLVPPHVPRISKPGDDSHFETYRNGDMPMEGTAVAINANASSTGGGAGVSAIKSGKVWNSMNAGEFAYF